MAVQTSAPWVRYAVDAAPAVGFLAALLITHDFPTATWVLMGASALALAVSLILERRIAPIPAFSGGLALVFGGLSLALHRSDILQMKMTVVDGVLGAILFVGLAIKRNPLKILMGGMLTLDDRAWATLAFRYGLFWWACAIANEIVRRTQTAEVWATFRVGAIAAAVAFAVLQTPYLMKHMADPQAAKTPEPPEPGF
ncbi:MAG: inner membrane-spanning protein YciB [Caulobacterales bacterium]